MAEGDGDRGGPGAEGGDGDVYGAGAARGGDGVGACRRGAAGDGVGSRAADGVGVGSGARATATEAGQPGGVDRARGVVGRGDTGDGNQKISKVLLI